MGKKIKSFTVDEEVYNGLMTMFRKEKAQASISSYIEAYLRELSAYFEAIRLEMEKSSKNTVPMSFILDSFSKEIKLQTLSLRETQTDKKTDAESEVGAWQARYDDQMRQGINLSLAPDIYKEIVKVGKKFPVPMLIGYVLRVLYEEVKRGKELTSEELDELFEATAYEEYRKHVKRDVAPKVKKLDPDLMELINKFRVKEKSQKKE